MRMPIRTLIVDDEPLARERVAALLKKEADVTVIGECGDGKSALRAITRMKPDLIFLDIQLPEQDGFTVVESLPCNHAPSIIFVTAYDQFAVKAFKVHAVDYLLKPVDEDRLKQALARARARLENREHDLRGRILALLADLEAHRGRAQRIMIKSEGEIFFLKPSEVDWVESAGNYVCVHAAGQTHIWRETMNQVERQLLPHNFVRIHRSKIVNFDRIRRLKPNSYGDYSVELRDGTTLTMSRVYRDSVLKLLR